MGGVIRIGLPGGEGTGKAHGQDGQTALYRAADLLRRIDRHMPRAPRQMRWVADPKERKPVSQGRPGLCGEFGAYARRLTTGERDRLHFSTIRASALSCAKYPSA